MSIQGPSVTSLKIKQAAGELSQSYFWFTDGKTWGVTKEWCFLYWIKPLDCVKTLSIRKFFLSFAGRSSTTAAAPDPGKA